MTKGSYVKILTFVAAASLLAFAASNRFMVSESDDTHRASSASVQALETNARSTEPHASSALSKDITSQPGIAPPITNTRMTKPEISQSAAKYGYGEFVDNAVRLADPKNSLEAARLLKECEKIDSRLEHYRSNLNANTGVGRNNTAFLKALANGEDIQRRCQAVTKSQHEQYTRLLETAAKGGALGAASDYYFKLPAKELDKVAWLGEALKRDANLGDINAMRILACDQIGSSASSTERLAYFQAVKEIAKGDGLVAAHATAIIEYCASPPNLAGAVDAAMFNKLLAAAQAAGSDHLWN